jgi:hypothetical protein
MHKDKQHRWQYNEPRQALDRLGQGIAGITPGAGGVRLTDATSSSAVKSLDASSRYRFGRSGYIRENI